MLDTYTFAGMLWKYNKNNQTLESRTGGHWKFQDIRWKIPDEGKTNTIEEMGTSKALGSRKNVSNIVILETLDASKFQMWTRSKKTSSDYFTLRHSISGKFLSKDMTLTGDHLILI